MSENCETSACSGCEKSCEDRKAPLDLTKKPHELSRIGKVIGVVSGKGGVGKSLVTTLMALEMNRRGYKAGILDADITGPSIPKAFGLKGPVEMTEEGVYPARSRKGVDVMSVNLLLENETDPVLWRSPIITGTVSQFWQEVIWKDVDYLFIDMPPGTGDVYLTVYQSIKLDGILVVTSPQELVSMIVGKAVKMAERMNVPILGLVENMSYFRCPDNGRDYKVFGESHIEETASRHGLKVIGRLPIDPELTAHIDKGAIEDYETEYLRGAGDLLEKL